MADALDKAFQTVTQGYREVLAAGGLDALDNIYADFKTALQIATIFVGSFII